MTTTGNPYTDGYEAAYREIRELLGDERKAEIDVVVTVLMETLAGKLSQDEFYGLAVLLEDTGTRIRDLDGNIAIDFWGMANGISASECGFGEVQDVRG